MKNFLLYFLSLIAMLFFNTSWSQELLPDQNPQYAVSRSKYMLLSDSINQWHSTTFHQTYKAYDWYEARQERRADRRLFNRQIQLERARYGYYYQPYHRRGYYNRGYYNNYYRNPFSQWRFCW